MLYLQNDLACNKLPANQKQIHKDIGSWDFKIRSTKTTSFLFVLFFMKNQLKYHYDKSIYYN